MTTAHQLGRKLLDAPNYELVVKAAGAAYGTRVVDIVPVNYVSPESHYVVSALALVASVEVDRVQINRAVKVHAAPTSDPRAAYKEFPVGTAVFVREHDSEWDNTDMGCLEPFGSRGVVAKSTDDAALGEGDRIFVRFTDKEVDEYKSPLTKSVVMALKSSTIAARLPR